MNDPSGEEWLLVDQAAADARVRPGTIYTWAQRGKVRSVRVGPHRYVSMTDVRHAETEWRRRLVAGR